MQHNRITKFFLSFLILSISLLPAHVSICQAEQETDAPVLEENGIKEEKETSTEKKPEVGKTQRVEETTEAESGEPKLSTGMKVGIGAGAVVLIGAVVAAASGGSSGDGGAVSTEPPTADQLVGAWSAVASQPGSGKTYTGTFQLFSGGGLAYDISVSDGEHFVGGGGWNINSYTLYIRTDHGSLYSGNFVPGIYTTIALNANTGWSSTLSR